MPYKRAPRPEIVQRRETVIALAKQGVRPGDIAKQLGYTESQIEHDVTVLKKLGQWPGRMKQIKRPPQTATIRAMLRLLDPAHVRWLLRISDDGRTLPEVLASIVRDAYFDENGDA